MLLLSVHILTLLLQAAVFDFVLIDVLGLQWFAMAGVDLMLVLYMMAGYTSQKNSSINRAAAQWMLYNWFTCVKLGVFYFRVLSMPAGGLSAVKAHEILSVSRSYAFFIIAFLTPLMFAFSMGRIIYHLFQKQRVTVESLTFCDIVVHVLIDLTDCIASFRYAALMYGASVAMTAPTLDSRTETYLTEDDSGKTPGAASGGSARNDRLFVANGVFMLIGLFLHSFSIPTFCSPSNRISHAGAKRNLDVNPNAKRGGGDGAPYDFQETSATLTRRQRKRAARAPRALRKARHGSFYRTEEERELTATYEASQSGKRAQQLAFEANDIWLTRKHVALVSIFAIDIPFLVIRSTFALREGNLSSQVLIVKNILALPLSFYRLSAVRHAEKAAARADASSAFTDASLGSLPAPTEPNTTLQRMHSIPQLHATLETNLPQTPAGPKPMETFALSPRTPALAYQTGIPAPSDPSTRTFASPATPLPAAGRTASGRRSTVGFLDVAEERGAPGKQAPATEDHPDVRGANAPSNLSHRADLSQQHQIRRALDILKETVPNVESLSAGFTGEKSSSRGKGQDRAKSCRCVRFKSPLPRNERRSLTDTEIETDIEADDESGRVDGVFGDESGEKNDGREGKGTKPEATSRIVKTFKFSRIVSKLYISAMAQGRQSIAQRLDLGLQLGFWREMQLSIALISFWGLRFLLVGYYIATNTKAPVDSIFDFKRSVPLYAILAAGAIQFLSHFAMAPIADIVIAVLFFILRHGIAIVTIKIYLSSDFLDLKRISTQIGTGFVVGDAWNVGFKCLIGLPSFISLLSGLFYIQSCFLSRNYTSYTLQPRSPLAQELITRAAEPPPPPSSAQPPMEVESSYLNHEAQTPEGGTGPGAGDIRENPRGGDRRTSAVDSGARQTANAQQGSTNFIKAAPVARGDESGLISTSAILVYLNCRNRLGPVLLNALLIGPDMIRAHRLCDLMLTYTYYRLATSFLVQLLAFSFYPKSFYFLGIVLNALVTLVHHIWLGQTIRLIAIRKFLYKDSCCRVVRTLDAALLSTKPSCTRAELASAIAARKPGERERLDQQNLEAALQKLSSEYTREYFLSTPGEILPLLRV